jgi:hypothetical protein
MRRVHAKDFACRVSVQRLTISGDRLSCRKQEAPHRDNKLASGAIAIAIRMPAIFMFSAPPHPPSAGELPSSRTVRS